MNKQFMIDDQPELFRVEGQLAEEDVLFIKETSGLGGVKQATGGILTPLRDKSKFSIGEPVVLIIRVMEKQFAEFPESDQHRGLRGSPTNGESALVRA